MSAEQAASAATGQAVQVIEAERQRIAQADQRIAAARARVERLGGALHVVGAAGGRPSFIATRWNLVRELADVDAVETWLAQVEPRAAR